MPSPLYVEIIGYLASIFIPLAFLPQTIKTIKTKETKNISLIAYSIYFTGVVIFFVYAVLLNITTNWQAIPMIVCQTINGIFSATILSITVYNAIKGRNKK